MNRQRFVTVANDPKEKLQTQYGHITYLEWCQAECSRMQSKGDKVEVVTLDNGYVALSR